MRNLQKILLVVVLFIGTTTFASASAFDKGTNVIGPHFGYGWHGLNVGLWYEHGVHKYVGIGVQVEVPYSSWGGGYYGYYTGHVVGIRALVTIAGHIPIRQVPNLDLFIKLGLGYGNSMFLVSGSTNIRVAHYFAYNFTVGIRYFFTNKVGVRVELGWPHWALVGVDFKF